MQPSKILPGAKFLLLGGSHTLAIRDAANRDAVSIAGGMLDTGRNLNIAFYRRAGLDVVFNDPNVDARYRGFLASLGIDRIDELRIPLLCIMGMNLVYLSRTLFAGGFALADGPDTRFLSRAALTETVRAMISGSLEFYSDLASIGIRTFSALPPRAISNTPRIWCPELFLSLEDIVKQLIEQAGAAVIDHRPQSLDEDGTLKAEFRHPDPEDNVHGSAAFGRLIILDMLARIDTAP